MNKRHWNTVVLDGSVPLGGVTALLDLSYTLVVKGRHASERAKL